MIREEAINILNDRIKALKRARELRKAELDQWTPLDEGEAREQEALALAITSLKQDYDGTKEEAAIQYSKGYQDGFLAAKGLFEEKGEGE